MERQELALWLKYVSILTLSAICFYLAAKPLTRAVKMLCELFVMYRIFNAESSHGSEKASNRLYTFTCSTKNLDEATVNEIFHFLMGSALKSNIGDDDKSRKALHKVLSSYSHILLYRDKISGTLRGTVVMGFRRQKEYTVLKVGLTFFDKGYRGGPFGYFMASFCILKELALHPLTPLYIVAKVFSYKGYLVGLTVKGSYPRYNRPTPKFLKKIFKEHAQSVMIEGDSYDEETFVLKQERTRINDSQLPVSKQELQDPDIRFFIERNPGYVKGHCLVMGCRMTWSDIFSFALKRSLVRRKNRCVTPLALAVSPPTRPQTKQQLVHEQSFDEQLTPVKIAVAANGTQFPVVV